ncbi:MAG: T9SS type A sorting domain-containing protein [Flavobacteriales bacterium]
MKRSLLTLILSGCIGISLAQTSKTRTEKDYRNHPYWIDMMQDPQANFFETQKAFYSYWKGRKIEKGAGYKPFKRWEHFMAQQVDERGNKPSAAQLLNELNTTENLSSTENSITGQVGNWTEIGPVQLPNNGTGQPNGLGRINAIGFHPTNANVFYVGAPAGGLWKTTDAGSSWSSSTDGLATLGVSSIVVDHSNPNTVYFGSGDRDASDSPGLGVYKSTDAGATWTQMNSGMGNRTVGELLMHPTNHNILLAATNGGVYRSTNGGSSWSQSIGGNFKDMKFHPTNPSIVYATTGGTLYKSTNNGTSFSMAMSGIPSGKSRLAIGVSPASPNVVYVLAAQGSVYGGLFKSTNSGASFTTQSTSPNIMDYSTNGSGTSGQAWYDMCVAVSPTNANEVYVGGVNIFKSTNGGASWTINAHWVGSGGASAIHADQHILRYSPAGKLYVGNDGGVYHKGVSNNNWTDISSGLAISQCYKLGQSQTDVNRVIVGYQDNGTGVFDNGTWRTEIGGDGMESAIDYSNSAYMYGELYYGAIRRSTNNGYSFGSIAGNGINGINESGAWVTPYVLHSTNPNVMFIGYQDIWRSTNVKASSTSSVNWTAISNNLGGSSKFNFIEHNEANENILYASKGSTLYKSENVMASSVTWSTVSVPGGGTILSIETSPLNENIVYVSRGSRIYKSTDKGSNWTDISSNISNSQNKTSLVFAPMNEGRGLYVATDYGVFFKPENETVWIAYSNGLPHYAKIKEIELFEDQSGNNNHKIRAASYGRGLWTSPIYNTGNNVGIDLVNSNVCLGNSITLTGENAVTYFWQDDNGTVIGNSAQLTVSPTETSVYSCFGIMANGDTTMANATVNVLDPEVNIQGLNTVCAGEVLTLTASVPGTGVYTYAWSNGSTGASIQVSPTANSTYSVTATSSEGCTATASKNVTITNNSEFVVIELKTDNYAGETSWNLTGNSGNVYYTKQQGSYSNNNTVYYDTILCVTDTCLVFNISDSYGDGICCSYGQGYYKIYQGNGNLLASGGNFNSSTSENVCLDISTPSMVVTDTMQNACINETVTFTATGADSYSWTNASGSVLSTTNTLTVIANQTEQFQVNGVLNGTVVSETVTLDVENIEVSLSGNTEVCEGDLVVLEALGANSYTWITNFNASGSTAANNQISFEATTSTTVSVIGESSNGCLDTAMIEINVLSNPEIEVSDDNVACVGDEIVMTATGADSYLWSTGETGNTISVGNSATTLTTDVWVIGTTNSCSSDTIYSTLMWEMNPIVQIGGNTTYCVGDLVELTGAGADQLLWSTGETSNSISFTATQDTIITLQGTNSNGCISTIATIEISVNEMPNLIITGDTNVCEGDQVILMASGADSYTWSNGLTGSQVEFPAQDMVVTVTGTSNGCSTSQTLTIDATELLDVVVTGDNEVCSEDSIVLTATGADSYSWSNGATGSTVTLYNTSSTLSSISVVGSTNGCLSNSIETSLTWMDAPDVFITGNTEMCAGDTVLLTATGADNYVWSTGETTESILVTSLDSIDISVQGFSNGCTTAGEQTIELWVHEMPEVTISGNTEVCIGEMVTLTAHGAENYLWSNGDIGSTTTFEVNGDIEISVSGTTLNCSSEAQTLISGIENPIVTISGNTEVCEGETIFLTASGADSYLWSTGDTTASIEISNTSGVVTNSISVTGTTNGCTSDMVYSQFNWIDNPEVTINGNTEVCSGEMVMLTASGADSYLWSTGDTTASIEFTGVQSDTITVIGVTNNCSSSFESVSIEVLPLPTVSITGVTEVCEGEMVTLTASGADTYLWSTGETTASIEFVGVQNDTLTVIGMTNNCASSFESVAVEVIALPTISISGNTNVCQGELIVLVASGADNYVWSNGQTGDSIEFIANANQSIMVEGTTGNCSAMANVDVEVNSTPEITISGNTNVCIGETVELTASGADSYLWSTGETTETISFVVNDSMLVSVEGMVNGCGSSVAEVNIAPNNNSSYFVIEIKTDWYGYETTWELKDAQGNVVANHTNANGGWYQNNTTYYDTVYCALIGDCYTFTIKDSYGDGICCSYGMGHYKIYQNDGTMLAEGGAFNHTEVKDFCIVEPPFTISIPENEITVCEFGYVYTMATGADSYVWTDESGNIVSEEAALEMEVEASGVFTVEGISGTDTATQTLNIIVEEVNVEISGPTEICTGETVQLTATGGVQYIWSTDQIGASITVSPTETTSYQVIVISENGCEYFEEITVEVLNTHKVKIVIKTDWYGYETSWKLKDSQGNVVASKPMYSYQNKKKYKHFIDCLEDECYTLEVKDSYGDGMCCSYGYGFFKVFDENNQLLANGGQFNYQTSEEFCFSTPAASPLPYEDMLDSETPFAAKVDKDQIETGDISVYPNPTKGELNINALNSDYFIDGYEITDMMGRVLIDKQSVKPFKTETVNIGSFTPGYYLVKLKIGNTVKVIKITKS